MTTDTTAIEERAAIEAEVTARIVAWLDAEGEKYRLYGIPQAAIALFSARKGILNGDHLPPVREEV